MVKFTDSAMKKVDIGFYTWTTLFALLESLHGIYVLLACKKY